MTGQWHSVKFWEYIANDTADFVSPWSCRTSHGDGAGGGTYPLHPSPHRSTFASSFPFQRRGIEAVRFFSNTLNSTSCLVPAIQLFNPILSLSFRITSSYFFKWNEYLRIPFCKFCSLCITSGEITAPICSQTMLWIWSTHTTPPNHSFCTWHMKQFIVQMHTNHFKHQRIWLTSLTTASMMRIGEFLQQWLQHWINLLERWSEQCKLVVTDSFIWCIKNNLFDLVVGWCTCCTLG